MGLSLDAEIVRALTVVFKRVPPYTYDIENAREMRFALRLILNEWLELIERRVGDKKAYQQQALFAVDPGDEGIDDVRFTTAKVLCDALEEAAWGFKSALFGRIVPPEGQASNMTMSGVFNGIRTMLNQLDAVLEVDGTKEVEFSDNEESDDESNSTSKRSTAAKFSIIRAPYTASIGKTSTIPQLEDRWIVLPDSRGKIEERSVQHASHIPKDIAAERAIYGKMAHEHRQRAEAYKQVARAAAELASPVKVPANKDFLHQTASLKPEQVAQPLRAQESHGAPPGSNHPKPATVAPSSNSPPFSPSGGKIILKLGRKNTLETTRPGVKGHLYRQPTAKSGNGKPFAHAPKAVTYFGWTPQERLELLKTRRDYPTLSNPKVAAELHQRMTDMRNASGAKQRPERSGASVRQQLKASQDKGVTIESLEAEMVTVGKKVPIQTLEYTLTAKEGLE